MRLRRILLITLLAVLPFALAAASAEETCIGDGPGVCFDPDRITNPPDPRTLVPWPDNMSCTDEEPDLCPLPPP